MRNSPQGYNDLGQYISSGGTTLGTTLPDGKSLYDCMAGNVTTFNRRIGNIQVDDYTIGYNANAGAKTLTTVTDGACVIKSIIIYANGAQTADLTSCPITGLEGTYTFIDAATATQANLDTNHKQVSWGLESGVYMPIGEKIIITFNGTGPTATSLTTVITYYPTVNGGYLS